MKHLLTLIFCAICAIGYGQFAPTGTKTNFKNGIALGSKDSTAFGANDSLAVTIDRNGRFMYRGLGAGAYWKVPQVGTDTVPDTRFVRLQTSTLFRQDGKFWISDTGYSSRLFRAQKFYGDTLQATSSAGGKILSNGNSTVAEFGIGGGGNIDFHGFAGYNANRSSSYTLRSFTDKGYVDSLNSLGSLWKDTLTNTITVNGRKNVIIRDNLNVSGTVTGSSATFVGGVNATNSGSGVSSFDAIRFWASGTAYYQLKSNLSGSNTFTGYLPTKNNDTLAVKSDIPSLTGYVPYTGATTNVNLGSNNLTAGILEASSTIGQLKLTSSYWPGTATITAGVESNGTTPNGGYFGFNVPTSTAYTFAINSTSIFGISTGGVQVTGQMQSSSVSTGTATATSFVKSGGTSSQFLKADGSVDNNTYATTSALSGYLPLSGGILTGSIESIGGIVTSTGSFNNTITSLIGNNSTVLNAATATTGFQVAINQQNTSGRFQLGLEGSTPGNLATGNTAYSTNLLTVGNTDIALAPNQSVSMLLKGSTQNVLINTTTDNGTDKLQVNGSAGIAGSVNVNGSVTASSFSGAGTGLTGTASSLTAGAVTNGVYTTGSYSDPAWITAINYSKLTGTVPAWNQNTTGSAGSVVNALTIGTDLSGTSYNGSAAVTINNTSTLSSVTGRGATTASAISITNATASSSTTTGALVVNGGIGIGGAIWASSGFFESDERWKSITQRVTSTTGIDAVQWNWNITHKVDDRLHWGYSAQQVLKLLPEAVSMDKDGFLGIEYNSVFAYKIALLEKRIAELEKLLKK